MAKAEPTKAYADVRSGSQHLKAFAELTQTGFIARVFDLVNHQDALGPQVASSLEEAKAECENCVRGRLDGGVNIEWHYSE